MRSILHAGYLVVFWLVFFSTRALTALLRLVAIARAAAFVRSRLYSKPRILYLAAFFPGNAGYEERASAWAEILDRAGFTTRVTWCLPRDRFWRLLAEGRTVAFQLNYLGRRLWQCVQAVAYDGVVVQRELLLMNDYGGTFAERFLLALNERVALDFDDDISAAKHEPRPFTRFGRLMFESGTKFTDCLRLYPRFIAGSSYLGDLVREKRQSPPEDLVVIPTCIDLARYQLKRYPDPAPSVVSFGWIGGVGNLPYLDLVLPALLALSKEHPLRLVVISGQPYRAPVPFEIVNLPWSYDTQAASLLSLDIGLMPLRNTPENRGKCGFKLLQYMACGIVSVASAVTTNVDIVDDDEDGFLVHAEAEWESVLRKVLSRRERFGEIGRRATLKVKARYSYGAMEAEYLAFMQRLSLRNQRPEG